MKQLTFDIFEENGWGKTDGQQTGNRRATDGQWGNGRAYKSRPYTIGSLRWWLARREDQFYDEDCEH